ncbi:MAG: AMP-binding protein [Gammaproteobacteria bacterium]|nr:AMP-binding protein [Gammaproteobacteria bacterium]
MKDVRTLVELLLANRRVDRHIGYLEGEELARRVSYGELCERALGILWRLQRRGAGRGDFLILFLANNEAFIDGFWAALAGGIVPVPLAVGISDEHRWKLLRIARQLGEPWLYTERKGLQKLREFTTAAGEQAAFARLEQRALLIDEVEAIGRAADPVAVRPDDVAFIQYSSGSTSSPKGIVLTHANLLANTRGALEAARFTSDDVSLSWMPLTHDMGLIGFFIMMFACGIQLNLMPTDLFIRRPLLWTTLLSRHRATLTSSPNFGYRHYLKVLGDREISGIDLSAVRLIFNGAEPISVPLCDEFMDRLAPAGLARRAMFPVYGLAEASLAMTLPAPGSAYRSIRVDRHSLAPGQAARELPAGHPDALELMLLGHAIPYTELRLVDDADRPVAAGAVGHVQIRGANVTRGYFRAPQANAEGFTADGWLRTGDLGLIWDGQLAITGRAKEIIFVNGQNYYPHDLEAIAWRASGLELGKVAAAGCRPPGADTERLVLFVLHRGPLADFLPVAREVAHLVNEHAGLEVAEVVPIRRMPKTTSGKIQRVALEQAWLAGEFAAELEELERLRLAAHAATTVSPGSIEARLLAIVEEVLPDRRVAADDNLFDVGASSLALIQIHERIDREFPAAVELTELFEHPTVQQLARLLAGRLAPPAASG